MGLWVIHHSSGNATPLCKVTLCPVSLQLCFCGRFRRTHTHTHVIMGQHLFTVCYGPSSSLKQRWGGGKAAVFAHGWVMF